MNSKKINNFLLRSIVCLIFVCIVVFTALTFFVSAKTNESVEEINKVYMSEINVQLQQKFTSIIDLRLSQVKGVIRRTVPQDQHFDEEMLNELRTSAEVRDFVYLGFYTQDGRLEKIYGENVDSDASGDILASLQKDGNIVDQGVGEFGEKILLLGCRAEYPMADGGHSVALVAGIEMEELNDALFLYEQNAIVYTHIIDSEGRFVIRNSDAYRESYFERIVEEVGVSQGKNAEVYVHELQDAMNKGSDYYMILPVNGEHRQVFCSALSENTNWYLITIMSQNVMDNLVTRLDKMRLTSMFASLGTIMFVMILIFVRYFHLSREQMLAIEKARQEAMEANKAKSQFLSSMSHDIRTPMNAIVGMTEIALKNIQESERVEDCLRKVKLSSKHLLGLINDVLDMSKIESGKMTLNINQVSLRETMDDIVNIIQPQIKSKAQYFDIFINDIKVEDVYCDSTRLNQVLLNILSNAVKYTSDGGTIHVHLYQEDSPRGNDYIRTHFIIKDNGIGMTEEFQGKIFDTFTREDTERTSKIMGTGLGMAITKRIVDLMEGTIELTSAVNKGSTFSVILDMKKAEIKEEEMKLPPWNILVVDDNAMLCESAAYNLNKLGTNTEWTIDSREAISMIKERHERNEDYHFVLIDWKMPNMDGLQTIHEIRKLTGGDIPIFLISAYDWSDIEEEVAETNIEGFISKPLFKSTLYSCLRRYVQVDGDDSRALQSEVEQEEEIDFTGKRILLAEDIEINWEIANEILSSVGMELEHAENGKICVEMFERSELGYYDAILMDIRMPIMNGYDATEAIRALERADKGLPIIAMTADAFSDDVQHSLDVGMNAHIAKPLDVKELMRILGQYLK